MSETDSCMTIKENLEAIFNSIFDGIISLDNNLNVVSLNRAAERFFGVRKVDVLGKSCFCGDLLAEIRESLDTTIRSGTPVREFSFKLTDGAGDERTAILSTAPLKDDKGYVKGVVLIVHDISEIRSLEKRLDDRPVYHKLIGRNQRMRHVFTIIEKVAKSDAPALIEGESGSGKGLIAEAIHYKSARRNEPFVKVNCAALSESLLESELFGHAKGSFTGAFKDRIGRFETAGAGTLFLDEIGEIPLATQVKLLNVLQDKTIERVGESTPRKVNARIISATNRSLKELIDKKMFREDLYYRLKVVRIETPPLRERIDDIEPLVASILTSQRKETGKNIESVSKEAMKLLMKYRWPGNVRELENAIAQAFVLCDDNIISPDSLPPEITNPAPTTNHESSDERSIISDALQKSHGKKSQAAKILGIDRTTLWRKMKEFHLS